MRALLETARAQVKAQSIPAWHFLIEQQDERI